RLGSATSGSRTITTLSPRLRGSRPLSGDPLTDVRRAVLERDTTRFALRQERNGVAIHERHLLQVDCHRTRPFLLSDEIFQPHEMLRFDAPAQGEAHDPALRRSLYFQHRAFPVVGTRTRNQSSRRPPPATTHIVWGCKPRAIAKVVKPLGFTRISAHESSG